MVIFTKSGKKDYRSEIWEGVSTPPPRKVNLQIPELSSSLGAGFQNLGSTQGLQIAVWSTSRRYGKYSNEPLSYREALGSPLRLQCVKDI